MRYIQYFKTAAEEQAAIDNKELGKPYVAYLEDEQRIDWNTKGNGYNYYKTLPLTFEILSGGTIVWADKSPVGTLSRTIQYRKNGGEWIEITSSKRNFPTINVETGDIVEFVGDNRYYTQGTSSSGVYGTVFSGSTCGFKIYGNILSLIDSQNYANMDTLSSDNSYDTFTMLFSYCANLTDAKNLVLPVHFPETASYHQLQKLFKGCTNLSAVSALYAGSTFYVFNSWLEDVSPTGTFVKHPNATWPTGPGGIPEGWTVEDAVL